MGSKNFGLYLCNSGNRLRGSVDVALLELQLLGGLLTTVALAGGSGERSRIQPEAVSKRTSDHPVPNLNPASLTSQRSILYMSPRHLSML